MTRHIQFSRNLIGLVSVAVLLLSPFASGMELKVLFIGDNGHHRPVERFHDLAPGLEERGILLKYTDRMDDLTPEVLADFDGMILFANIDSILPSQADAVLEFVANGKGFIPIHSATYCWRNNSEMVRLMGAQFQRHGGQVFGTQIAAPEHPIMAGFSGFRSWDETYIHTLHNEENRTVLEYRIEGEQADGQEREPWTWVRTHGNGRVFYTAWGHDHRTWRHPGFLNLIERGVRWACGSDDLQVPSYVDGDNFTPPPMTAMRTDPEAFQYVDVGPKIPNYTPGRQWGVQGAPKSLMQLPLSPEESIRHYVMPQGMALKLYADERNFEAKPIAMTWDEQGRLWVCETVDYPNELGENRDRIRICEDTDGDYVADKFTVFAEGLSVPTAIVICRGGAVVQNATETIYLKDTNGDGRADLKTVLITGWGAGDTHGGVSNFRYGLDNWIWAMQGYNESTPRFGDDSSQSTQSFRQGFWRFRLSDTEPPVVTDLEFVRSTNNNTWGLGISEEGLIFGSTANHNPSTFMPIANRYYEKVRGWAAPDIGTIADTHLFKAITENVRQVDQFGGYTAGAGHAIYTARTFPPQWWNRTALVCEPTGHLIGTFVLTRDGSAYKSTSPVNLLASDDEWASPIMAEVGPDGAVWVIDWYNFIIQHNPTPQGFRTGKGNAYESELRDKKRGRIYRVVPQTAEETTADSSAIRESGASKESLNRDLVHEWTSLSSAGTAELVSTLQHPSMTWRLHAQRLLTERQAIEAVPLLQDRIADQTVDAIGLNVGAIHALWVLHALGRLDEATLKTALSHPSAGVRRNGLAVLPMDDLGRSLILNHYNLLSEADVQTRLQGLLFLSELSPNPAVGELVAEMLLRRTPDQWEGDAVTVAASTHSVHFLRALAEKSPETERPPADSVLRVTETVSVHIARSRPASEQMQTLLSGLLNSPPSLTDVILRGLTNGWPRDHRIATGEQTEPVFQKLLAMIPPAGRGKLLQLASFCGSRSLESYAKEIVDSLLHVASDGDTTVAERVRAAREAVSFQSENMAVLDSVLDLVTVQTPPDLAAGIIEAAGLSSADELGEQLVRKTADMTPQAKAVAIRVLMTRPTTTMALLRALESGSLDIGDLTLDQKQALRTHPDRRIRADSERLMAAGGGLPDADRDRVLKELLPICEETGDVSVGKAMFVKHCAKCHIHGTEGKAIGPNLTGMAVHPKHELLTHIIDPSRSVEGNFRIYTVVRTDGIVINGMMSGESRTAITLIDTEGRENQIPREDIDELVRSRKSLMPEGFEKQMTVEELSSLLEFLTDKGKYLPISLDRYATAVSTKGLFHTGDNGPDRMIFEDWMPKVFRDVPFILTDPRGKSVPNIILLHGPNGSLPPSMPRTVTLPCNTEAKAIHLLSGVGGWSFPYEQRKSVSLIVRLRYRDGQSEDVPLVNGVHFADYIRRVDVPGSDFAFSLGSQQIRRVVVQPSRSAVIDAIELVKGEDQTAPIVMAVTIERP